MKKIKNIILRIKYIYNNKNLFKLRTNMLLLIFLFVLIIATILIYFSYFMTQKYLEKKKEADINIIKLELKKTSVKFNEEIKKMDNICSLIYNKYFSNIDRFMVYNNEDLSFKSFDKNVLDVIFELNRDISGFTILTQSGGTFSYYNPYSPYYYNSNKENYLNSIQKEIDKYKNDIILKYKFYENQGEYLQALKCSKNFKSNSELFGMIVTEKNTGDINNWLNGFKIYDSGKLLLVDEKREIIFCNDNIDILSNLLNKFKILEKLNDSSGFELIKWNGNEFYVFYDKSVYYGCNLISIINTKNIGADFPFVFLAIVSCLIIIFLCLVVFWFFKKKILLPINDLEEALEKISNGEITQKIKIKEKTGLYPLAQNINNVIKKLQELIDKEYNSSLMKKQAELNALQSQINPHFLYNTLESIRGQALFEGVDNIAEMADSLSKLFRYSISKKNNLVTFKEEITNIENYLTIQKYCYNDRIKVEKDIQEDALKYRMPKLCIQPIIENAIKHGLETKMGIGTIKISGYITAKKLIISIEDDGNGIEEEELDYIRAKLLNKRDRMLIELANHKNTSIGLVNVNERIKLYFGNQYGIYIYSTKGIGTIIELVFPLIEDEIEYKVKLN